MRRKYDYRNWRWWIGIKEEPSKAGYRTQRNQVWLGLAVLFLAVFLRAVPVVGILLWMSAVAFLLAGSWHWAKYKGRSGWWALLGLLAPIGFIPLALMKDKYVEEAKNESAGD
jgi:hypothetical protein